jgi:lipid II:glycine glycyltransferase (peptidoglycan interpeptide bridge formation enzyme)
LVYDKGNFNEIFISFLKGIEKIAKKQGIILLKDISYPIHGGHIYAKSAPRILLDRSFSPNERATIFVDLAKPEDALWHSLKNSARKTINKSSNSNFEIGFMGKEQLNEYYNLLCESRKRVDVELPPTYPNEAMWNGLGADSGHLKVFSVRMNGGLLAAIGIVSFNGIIFETGPAQSDYSFNAKIYANDILKWEVIKWGSKNNNRIYDLSGIPAEIKNEKHQRQRQFKEKWGDQIVRYQSYYKLLF